MDRPGRRGGLLGRWRRRAAPAPQTPPGEAPAAPATRSPEADHPEAAKPRDTISAEQTAGFAASALPGQLSRESEESGGQGAPPAPLLTEAALDTGPEGPLATRLHNWLPMAIVVVSVLAAIMGWRASLADEGAAHSDELARQDLVFQQQLQLQRIQGVDSDIRLFGQFEQSSLMGTALLRDGPHVGGPAGQALTREGQGDIEQARTLGSQFRYLGDYNPANPSNYYTKSNRNGGLQSDGAYRPGHPYRVGVALTGAESSDPQLSSLEPDALHNDAHSQRRKGVKLILLAALFIAALVFFTLAAVSRGLRTVSFSVVGVAVAVIALILFPIFQFA
jgi:hypothetical protein